MDQSWTEHQIIMVHNREEQIRTGQLRSDQLERIKAYQSTLSFLVQTEHQIGI